MSVLSARAAVFSSGVAPRFIEAPKDYFWWPDVRTSTENRTGDPKRLTEPPTGRQCSNRLPLL